MKTSEEMTERVLEKLNEHRQKVSRRNIFVKKITFGLVNPEKYNDLSEKFTDSEEMKGVGFMNRKISLIATAASLLAIMTATVSVISLNMGKPNLSSTSEIIESVSTTSETSTAYRTETAVSSVTQQILTTVVSNSSHIPAAKTTAVTATDTEKTMKIAKTTHLTKSTSATKAEITDNANNTVVTVAENEVHETMAETIPTEKVTEVQTTVTAVTAVRTEEPVHTTASPVVSENIDVFQLVPSKDGVEEFMDIFREKYGNDGRGNCYNVTPQEITEKYGMRIFKFDYDGRGTLYGEGFLLYENEIYPIGISFGGWGLTSFAVTDIDHDGSNELYFTFSFGSGIHRSCIAYFDTQSKEIVGFDYEYLDYDMILSDKNGMLSICHAEVADKEFTAGEELGRIEFIGDEIQLALLEN